MSTIPRKYNRFFSQNDFSARNQTLLLPLHTKILYNKRKKDYYIFLKIPCPKIFFASHAINPNGQICEDLGQYRRVSGGVPDPWDS
jgi:hypothetical protein